MMGYLLAIVLMIGFITWLAIYAVKDYKEERKREEFEATYIRKTFPIKDKEGNVIGARYYYVRREN